MTQKIFTITLICSSLAINACGRKDCFVQNREQASISQEALAQNVSIEFCKSGKRPGAESITTSSASFIQFAEYMTHDRPSRYDGSCSDMESARYNYGPVTVALTTSSFQKAKLCYSDASRTRGTLVPLTSACPAQTIAQIEPATDCQNF